MGQRDAFSAQDVTKVNKMYKCGDITPTPVEASSEPSVKPQLNAHNNVMELIGPEEEDNKPTMTTKRPSRPNRPLLSILGSFIGAGQNNRN